MAEAGASQAARQSGFPRCNLAMFIRVHPPCMTRIKPVRPLALLLLLGAFALNLPAASKPNLILIMADDLGYETLGANGGTSYKTPVLDQLAATGARFTHCFVQPLCTPTRVQLMTGQYNVRNYINFGNMDPKLTTFGNLLKPAGYSTCIVGKWQLGRDVELPKKFGFDEHCLWQHTRRPPRYANAGLEIITSKVQSTSSPLEAILILLDEGNQNAEIGTDGLI